MNTMPKIGSWVRLIGSNSKKTAKVIAHLDERPDYIEGGLRLDRRLNGFQYWNKADVEPAEPSGDGGSG